jgi:hypothetical protein
LALFALKAASPFAALEWSPSPPAPIPLPTDLSLLALNRTLLAAVALGR